MLALATRFETGRISARDCVRIIGAGLRGAGYEIADDDVGAMQADGGAAGFVDDRGALLRATFSSARSDGGAPRRRRERRALSLGRRDGDGLRRARARAGRLLVDDADGARGGDARTVRGARSAAGARRSRLVMRADFADASALSPTSWGGVRVRGSRCCESVLRSHPIPAPPQGWERDSDSEERHGGSECADDDVDVASTQIRELRRELRKRAPRAAVRATRWCGAFEGIAIKGKGLGDVLRTLALRLSEIVLKAALRPLEQGFGNFLTGLFSGGAGFAKGGVIGRGMPVPFAQGGVIQSPIAFPLAGGRLGVAGERGAEAILPLARGPDGRLGVAARGRRRRCRHLQRDDAGCRELPALGDAGRGDAGAGRGDGAAESCEESGSRQSALGNRRAARMASRIADCRVAYCRLPFEIMP